MGGGSWSADVYASTTSMRKAAGKDTFDYDKTVKTTGTWAVHDSLDPKKAAGAGSALEGAKVREARDSDEHPVTVPIMVFLDVTGSNIRVARIVHEKLPEFLGLVLRTGAVEAPQILMGAVGDATCDRLPLQVGQFESDNRIDDTLANLVLEGGGGGGKHESYELAAYYALHHVHTDHWDKRRAKGYLFFVGDELPYDQVSRAQVQKVIDDAAIEDNVDTKEVFRRLQERYEVFYVMGGAASYVGDASVLDPWRELLGQHVLEVEDTATIPEVIAATIATFEGGLDADDLEGDLVRAGLDAGTAGKVSKALVPATAGGGGAVAVSDSPEGLDGAGVDRIGS